MFTVFEKILFTALAIIALFFAYTLVVMLPYYSYAESKCLAAGYPQTKTTYNFKRYCLTQEGAIVPKVIEIN